MVTKYSALHNIETMNLSDHCHIFSVFLPISGFLLSFQGELQLQIFGGEGAASNVFLSFSGFVKEFTENGGKVAVFEIFQILMTTGRSKNKFWYNMMHYNPPPPEKAQIISNCRLYGDG